MFPLCALASLSRLNSSLFFTDTIYLRYVWGEIISPKTWNWFVIFVIKKRNNYNEMNKMGILLYKVSVVPQNDKMNAIF